ncbi:SOS response-associated peptidase [Alcaligenes nematophilus]|uniref:Abasic site processing protein n=1 Tax=Alcaligenes nematophilus TaxID=2994643 RepID=A0ABU3MX56_9BURK|nr:SOS response-associated peptidase [Alcaligenes nematophilus]MDT8506303.1 SOS response-associated peptidase [Alcaligenes nematophilus]MDT8527154.1 SOS response-associated peptidase [Alcaligenes nematophilus]
MCGRIRQAREPVDYIESMNWNPHDLGKLAGGLKYNVPPGTRPLVMHRLGDGSDQIYRLFWGYKPEWYKRSPVINARLDTILKKSPMWRSLLRKRVLVPADGWFEWTGETGDKQPWYIHSKDDSPLYLAAITAWQPDKENDVEHGFAIVTDASAGGMVDIHDRRPVVLTLDDAREWASPETDIEAALELLSTARPETAFKWHPVTRRMSNVKYQAPNTNQPNSILV